MSKLVRYSDADLKEFKAIIENKLEKAETELQYLQDQVSEAATSSSIQKVGDYSDDSSRHTEIEMLNNMAARQAFFIRNLKNALLRIQNKTYGICTVTGELISKERLKVVPHATKTISGKNDEKKTLAFSKLIKTNSSSKIKNKIVSKTSKKEKTTSSPPTNNEDDLILNIEELPKEMLPPSEEGFEEI